MSSLWLTVNEQRRMPLDKNVGLTPSCIQGVGTERTGRSEKAAKIR